MEDLRDVRQTIDSQASLQFGPYELLPLRKLLLMDGKPVRLGSRALDILIALVERAGEVLNKGELISAAWPDTFVEESSLRVHIAALRRILGHGEEGTRYIINIAGRGYCFTAPVKRELYVSSAEEVDSSISPGNLPALPTRVFGRIESVKRLTDCLLRNRLTSIVGAGGLGKTTLAISAAESLRPKFKDGVFFVDFSPVDDQAMTLSTVAEVLGIVLSIDDPINTLLKRLQGKRMLIVLDNCEHLLNEVATIAQAIVSNTTDIWLLTTTREAFKVPNEWIFRIEPLKYPDAGETVSKANFEKYAAVELFIERATAVADTFRTDESSLSIIGEICRDVEGLPLAIEMVAAQVSYFTLADLATRVREGLLLDVLGNRTAGPRHRSFSALVEWSYELLSPEEKRIFRCLSLFPGSFTQDAAVAVACDGESKSRTLNLVIELVGKSLVSVDVSSDQVRYRMPVLTRAYAEQRHLEDGKRNDARRRHAEYTRDALLQAQEALRRETQEHWLKRHRPLVDDARAALDWAFGADGDLRLGLEVTVGFTTLAARLWLVDELKNRITVALTRYPFETDPAPTIEARLNVAMGGAMQMTKGVGEAVIGYYARAMDVATRMGLSGLQVEALAGAWAYAYGIADYKGAQSFAQQLLLLGKGTGDGTTEVIADRAMAQSLSGLGDHSRAKVLAERVLLNRHKLASSTQMWLPVDVAVTMRVVKARSLWLLGSVDQAVDIANEAIEVAFDDVAYSPCQAWGMAAIPIAIWRGDFVRAQEMVEDMAEHSERLGLGWWIQWSKHYGNILRYKTGQSIRPNGVTSGAGSMLDEYLAATDQAYCSPETATRIDAGLSPWVAPEILRHRAVAHAALGDTKTAKSFLEKSSDLARQHRALSWELRAAASLVEITGNEDDRAALALQAIVEQFTEGSDTADLISARALLSSSLRR